MNTIRIILFALILIGLGLLATKNYWLEPVVEKILEWQGVETMVPIVPATASTMPAVQEVEATTTTVVMSSWNWVTATTAPGGLQFKYPNPLPTKYVSAVDWPPRVTLSAGTLVCSEDTLVTRNGEKAATKRQIINGRDYCVAVSGEGAAGSTYTIYHYRTAQGNSVASIVFTLRTPQCVNYDEPERVVCTQEQADFDEASLADQILESITRQ